VNQMLSLDVQHHAALDKRMEKAVRGIRLLESVSWPQSVQQQFLADWRSGIKKLPVVMYQAEQHSTHWVATYNARLTAGSMQRIYWKR
jgi:hypothetical protein